MTFDIDAGIRVFTPEYGGNRDLPEEKRIKIHHSPLSYNDEQRAIRETEMEKQAAKDAGQEFDWIRCYSLKCLRSRVLKIENLNIRKDGKDVPVNDITQLMEGKHQGLSHIAVEFSKELNRIEAEQRDIKKKSSVPSQPGSMATETIRQTSGRKKKKSRSILGRFRSV